MYLRKLFLSVLFLLMMGGSSFAASRFWVGATGDWDASNTAVWSATTGGAGGASVPGVGDTAVFDQSNTVVTIVYNTTVTQVTHTRGTINTDGPSGTSGLTHSWGTFSGSNSNTRVLNMGNSTIHITASGTAWTVASSSTSASVNLTLNAGTSNLIIEASSNMNMGGRTYATVTINSSGSPTVGTGVYGTLIRNGTATKTDGLTLSGSITVTGNINFIGNSATNRLLVESSVDATARTITNTGASGLGSANVDFQDISMSETEDFSTITGGSGDAGGNTRITFTPAEDQTWSGTTGGNWSTNAWSGRVPLPQDNVIVDADFSAAQSIVADMPRLGKSISFTEDISGTPTFDISTTASVFYGSLTLTEDMATAVGNTLSFMGRSSFTVTSAGHDLGNLTINGGSGTLVLQDSLTLSGTLSLILGTISANDNDITMATLFASGTRPRGLTMGNGRWVVTSTGTVWDMTTVSTLTITPNNSTIVITDTSATQKTFIGAGKTFGNISFVGDNIVVTGSNNWSLFSLDNAGTTNGVKLTSGSSQSVAAFSSNGTSGSLAKLQSTTAGVAATVSKVGGTVSIDYTSIKDSTAVGGALWFAGDNSTNVSGNSGWTFTAPVPPPALYAKTAGGNWSDPNSWSNTCSACPDSSGPPTNSDDVYFDGTSGPITVDGSSFARSVNFTGYTGTLTHNAGAILFIGDSTAGAGDIALKMSAGMTYTLGNSTSSEIDFVSTSPILQTVDVAGKTLGKVNFNGTNGKWALTSGLTTGNVATVTLTRGTLQTDGILNTSILSHTWGGFASSNSNTRVLTLGKSLITLTSNQDQLSRQWNIQTSTNLNLTAGTSTITMTGNGTTSHANMNFYGGGKTYYILRGLPAATTTHGFMVLNGSNTFTNFEYVGTASTENGVGWLGTQTVTGIFKAHGFDGTSRITIWPGGVGNPGCNLNITGATLDITNADFQEFNFNNGGSNVNLASITGGSGDCGGNTMIGGGTLTFTTAVPQTWNSTSGGNWSDAAKWTSRSPLCQDNVTISQSFLAGQTIATDKKWLGKNIDFTGTTGNPTFQLASQENYSTGSVTMVPTITWDLNGKTWFFSGRGTFSFTSGGVPFSVTGGQIKFQNPHGIFNLQDDFRIIGNASILAFYGGTFNTNNHDLNASIVQFQSNSSVNQTIMNLGSSTFTTRSSWIFTSTNSTDSRTTINSGTSTIVMSGTTSQNVFEGGNKVYYKLQLPVGVLGNLIQSSNTFNRIIMPSGGVLTMTAGTTQTILDGNSGFGNGSNPLSIDSTISGTPYNFRKTLGFFYGNTLTLQDSTATGGATFYAGEDSVDVSGNSGWIFSTPPLNTSAQLGNVRLNNVELGY